MRSSIALTLIGLAALASAVTVGAQTPAPRAAAFEVASLKPSNPDPNNPMSMVPMVMPQPGGRLTVSNLPLKLLVRVAYEVQDFQIVGGPPWFLTNKYDITAKAEGPAMLGAKEMPPLLKNLLIDRFKLKTHNEQREMPVYDLVIARSDGRLGPDLKPSKSDCSNVDELNAKRAEAIAKGDLTAVLPKPGEFMKCAIGPNLAGGPMNIGLHGDGQEVKVLLDLLTQMTGRIVRDKTGLTGRYDFDMKLDMQALMAMAAQAGVTVPAAAAANFPQSDGSSLMTALNEQLGLKLESARGPVDVLVIDSAELPVPD